MAEVLNRELFFLREHVGLLKAAFHHDILDPETGKVILKCREQNLGRVSRICRFSEYKRLTPFDIRVTTPDNQQVIRVERGVPVFTSLVRVFDESEALIGGFKQRLFSISGDFDVFDANDETVCRLKGGLTGWSFKFVAPDNVELASVTKQWAGLGKELLTGAADYVLRIDGAVPEDSTTRRLILASAICIGLVVKVNVP